MLHVKFRILTNFDIFYFSKISLFNFVHCIESVSRSIIQKQISNLLFITWEKILHFLKKENQK